jgi:xanthine dehydrogenase/oxidase
VSGTTDEGVHNALLPSDFINISMRRKVIGKIIFPSLSVENCIFKSYKIMPRAQNSYSYVNAAFLLHLNDSRDSIQSAGICYGGISEYFTHAERTEKFLIGKNVFTNEVLQQAIEKLLTEIQPDEMKTNASCEYRKNLAVSLFYKFILKSAPEKSISSVYKTGAEILKRDISSGSQSFEYIESRSKLYKSIPKFDGDIQCTGEAKYVDDLPIQFNELHAAFILGDKVHGIIESIDASEALKIKGVYAVYTAKDIPGLNNFMPLCFDFNYDVEEVFCSKKLLYHGQPVGIILAESFDLAQKARNFVKVNYTFEREDEPVYPTVREVYKAKVTDRLIDAPKYYLKAEKYGDNSKHKISGYFEMASTQYHHHMETQQCICVPSEDGMDIYSSSQWTDTAHVAVSEVLKVPQNTLNFYVRRVGGAFGAKITRHAQVRRFKV